MKFIPGNYLFDVHDNNDIVTNKSVLRYVQYCDNQLEVNNTVEHLLNSTKGVTKMGWVRIYLETETQNRWPR